MNEPYQLTPLAKFELREITDYTIDHHGLEQARRYVQALEQAASRMALGEIPIKKLPKIHTDLRMVRSQKHYIFGLCITNQPMLILAILHERMDIFRHLKHRLENH
jgi:toxin ParE1/3/4